MAENLVIESPDFDDIRRHAGSSAEDAIKLLWYALNDEIKQRHRHRFRWEDISQSQLAFSASAGTWTVGSGDVTKCKLVTIQDWGMFPFVFDNTTTSAGMGTELYIQLPYSLIAVGGAGYSGALQWFDGVNTGMGFVKSQTSNPQLLTLVKSDGSAWSSGITDALDITGSIVFQVG